MGGLLLIHPYGSTSLSQAIFWSPDAVQASSNLHTSQNGERSNTGAYQENSSDEPWLELDGRDTQVKPVYHKLPGTQVREIY
ncbi:acid protease [Penicillium argentinense]|uniref:Acid protease n=1 Tax=Penicillium argentinense TaxID=1131581 RepID=A0A9W9ENG1_9EURO|nr:acid protease [Penicillium argentinense]KAJ5085077.1 acid protease [Penicillium argentinense]